jgi:hypothetical protein
VLDEDILAFLPSRVFDPMDILFYVLAAVIAAAASVALGWARRRFGNAHLDSWLRPSPCYNKNRSTRISLSFNAAISRINIS